MSNLQKNKAVPNIEAMLQYIVEQNPEGVTELALQQGIVNPPRTPKGRIKFLLKAIEIGSPEVGEAVFRLHPDFSLFDSFIREEIESTVAYESFSSDYSNYTEIQPKELGAFEGVVAKNVALDPKGFAQVLRSVSPNLPILYSDADLVNAAFSLSETGKASLLTLMGDSESYAVPIGAIAEGVGALANLGTSAIQGATQKKLAAMASRDNALNNISAIRLANIQAQGQNQQNKPGSNQTLIWVGVGFAVLVLGLITFLFIKRK